MTRFEIHPDIREAWTPPAEFYREQDNFDASRSRIFESAWHFVTDSDRLKAPGHVLPFTLLEGMVDEPLLLARDRDDKIRCLSNVCTHRGNLVVEGEATLNTLRCRYHGKRFGLDGKFQFMPEFEGCKGFPCEADHLSEVALGSLGKWLFASLRPHSSFDKIFQPVIDRVGWLPFNEFRHDPARAREYMVRGHWALYVDNYLEGFHIPYIHAALNATLDYENYTTELYEFGNLQLGVGKDGEECFDLPTSSPDYGNRISAYYYWLFPNLMLNFYPWGLSINVVRPIAPDLTKVNFIPYVWREEKRAFGAGADLDRVEREDEAIVELVQKGMKSRIYSRGRYSPMREQGTHQFHRLIQQFLF